MTFKYYLLVTKTSYLQLDPGQVLKDMLDSGEIPVIELTEIYGKVLVQQLLKWPI